LHDTASDFLSRKFQPHASVNRYPVKARALQPQRLPCI